MSTTFPATASGGIMAQVRRVERWLDDRGRFAWFLVIIAGFVLIWPVGLALLVYTVWSKRMFSRTSTVRGWRGRSCRGDRAPSMAAVWQSSGNTAFDAYKAETLRRLEDEQHAFESFLQRLRDAKDKSQFDNFMEERARASHEGAADGDTPPPPAAASDEPRAGTY